MYDVIIIGAGVSGSACARELSRYRAKIGVLEKEEDVCCGTTKANSAIIHAGFDADEGSLMAKLNVQGNEMMDELAKELDIPFRRNGSLVLCLNEEDREGLDVLYKRGVANGVKDLRILSKEELKTMEPNISDNAVSALFAPTGGIVCPFELNIGLAENAAENGVEFHFNEEVLEITKKPDGTFLIRTEYGEWETKYIVNAAGVYADVFHNSVSAKKIHITPRKGEYCLLDKTYDLVDKTVFTLPGKYGKGVLVTPTIHGNVLLGPTATDIEDKEGTNTDRAGLDEVLEKAGKSVKNIPLRKIITSFSGLRAHEDHHEFIIQEVEDCEGFFDCAGIESPGLSSSPAIGRMISELVSAKGGFARKEDFHAYRKRVFNPGTLPKEEYKKYLEEHPEYGNIICRCETVSEGEILDAIHRPLGAKSLDGVKRRTRAGMGRCQSGFCSPKTMEILSRELGISMLEVTKSGGESKLAVGRNKEGQA